MSSLTLSGMFSSIIWSGTGSAHPGPVLRMWPRDSKESTTPTTKSGWPSVFRWIIGASRDGRSLPGKRARK
jgi:hypothetical protein